MKKAVIVLLVLSACLGVIGWQVYLRILEQRKSERRRGERVVAVEVTPVGRQTVRQVAEFTGTLLPRSRFVVAPKVPGRLERLLVNIGDPVRNGDLIAVLDGAEYAQQVAEAKAELEVSRANLADCQSALDIAEREYQRAKELREQKVASVAELEAAEARHRAAKAKHDVAEAQIKQRQAALKAAEVRLSYTRIDASWGNAEGTGTAAPPPASEPAAPAASNPVGTGTRIVAERFVDEGAMLRANDPIVSIVDLSTVLAIINVIERDFPQVRVGQFAAITTDAYPGRQFTGKVVRRAPVLREESRQARLEIEIPNTQGLLAAGMFVRARIQFAEHPEATVVPQTALVRRNDRQGVFLADAREMKARFVAVEVGISEKGWVEIVRPKLQGQVITLGQHLLEDGASISLPGGKPGSKKGAGSPSAAGGGGAAREVRP